MKTQNSLHLAGLLLLLLSCAALLGTAASAEAQEVHALLIILGNDGKIRASVEKNEGHLRTLLRLVSQDSVVRLTVMKSIDETKGIVENQTLSIAGGNLTEQPQGSIVTTLQVVEWLRALQPNPDDTVLVYYSGHGGMDVLGSTHILNFDPAVTNDFIPRDSLRELLEEKPARLKMLITDTCSNSIDVPQQQGAEAFATLRAKNRRYTKNLFLEHTGTLDITAASPKQYAWGNGIEGGYFTASLIQSFSADADRNGNNDGFLEWREVVPVCISETESLFTQTQFTLSNRLLLEKENQKTQTPLAHSLPTKLASSPEVHALLIILGDDVKIRDAVERNESHLKELMGRVSAHCPVQLTVLRSDRITGTVTTMSLADAKASDIQETKQEGPITSGQVEAWLNAVDTNPNDTVLIYYTGHAWTTNSGSHGLLFGDVEMADDTFARAELSSNLRKKPARLKMLITDTDGLIVDESVAPSVSYAEMEKKEFPGVKHLFLQHKGMLDITAASPGEYAWMDSKDGGFFTNALIESMAFAPDANKDGFISWTEVFERAQKLTQEVFVERTAHVPGRKQLTQTPVAYSLPEPVPAP